VDNIRQYNDNRLLSTFLNCGKWGSNKSNKDTKHKRLKTKKLCLCSLVFMLRKVLKLSHLNVPHEGYSRNVSYALNLISTFLLTMAFSKKGRTHSYKLEMYINIFVFGLYCSYYIHLRQREYII